MRTLEDWRTFVGSAPAIIAPEWEIRYEMGNMTGTLSLKDKTNAMEHAKRLFDQGCSSLIISVSEKPR